ncbi:four-carbon acid sugar kinase family protein, partial [uncultured Methylobacterium sp.]|uniref:four-carbon acid sugar kinase family protein n=1 Tax=uncultured Methylobacterium sp. TaxID=157278 RepID=UPI00259A0491
MSRPLPDGPLVAFYGDDFTGSSAAMEVLAFAGLETVLFLAQPGPERLAAFPGARAVGIAGVARSQPPAWMDRELPPAFRLLASLGAPVVHYKVCSTFDSAPHLGSIGRAAEIGRTVIPGGWTPMVVADPGMGRYQSFGHLFAMADGRGHRLDRHPTMARHPATPMDEADLALHLARQTALPTGLVDFVAMKRGEGDAALARARAGGAVIVSLDVLDPETLAEAGRLMWERGGEPVFALGSQGVEAALVAHWRTAGLLPAEAPP